MVLPLFQSLTPSSIVGSRNDGRRDNTGPGDSAHVGAIGVALEPLALGPWVFHWPNGWLSVTFSANAIQTKIQGYLAHTKAPTPPGPPLGP